MDAAVTVLPAVRYDQSGTPLLVRRYEPEDRRAPRAFYAAFEAKRAAQGLPPQGGEWISRWLNTLLPAGLHRVVERAGALMEMKIEL